MVQPVDWDFSGINNAISGFTKGLKENQQRAQGQTIGNLFASGDYAGAAKAAFASGDLDTGLKLAQFASGRADQAAAQKLIGESGIFGDPTVSGGSSQSISGLSPQASSGQKLPSMVRADPNSPAYVPPAAARDVYTGLLQRGLSPVAAAGVAGNIAGESSFRLGAVGDQGASIGLAQWQGQRASALKQFAASRGQDWKNMDVQLDYLVHELKGPEAKAFAAVQGARTPDEAANLFMRHFERPADWAMAQSGPKRAAMANSFYRTFGGANTPNVAVAPALAGVNQQTADASAQAGNVDPRVAVMGSTGNRGQTNPLPTSGDQTTFTPAQAVAAPVAIPTSAPVAGLPQQAPMPPERPVPTNMVAGDNAVPPSVDASTRIAPQMPAPSDQPPPWMAQQQAAQPQGTQVAQAGGAQPVPGAAHNYPAEAPATIQPGSPAAQSSNAMQMANKTLQILAASPNLPQGTRDALMKRYEYLTHFDAQRLDMDLKRLQMQQTQGEIAAQPDKRLGLQLDNARKGVELMPTRTLTPAEFPQYNIQPDYKGSVQIDGQGKLSFPGKPTTEVTVDNGQKLELEENKLQAQSAASFLGDMAKNAPAVAQRNADLDVLSRVISRTETGQGANTRAFLDRVGASLGLTEGKLATKQDAINAIVNRIAPTLHVPGSGSQSDIEFRGVLAAMPQLSATPEGNQLIIATSQRMANLDKARAAIAARWQSGRMKAGEARSAIADLDEKSIYASDKEKALIENIMGSDSQGSTPAQTKGWKILGVE